MDQHALLDTFKTGADRIDALMRADLAAVESPLLSEVFQHAIFQGGKRIRPLLTVYSAGLLGEPPPTAPRLGMVFEYLHAASLLHDDVIDHAELRRGKKTANRRWGNAPVILAGDYLHARAMDLAASIGGMECLHLVSGAVKAMVEAEFLQMRVAAEQDASEEHYFAVLHGKTAALIGAACEVGILHAGGNDKQRRALRTYGTHLGLAFQVVDDLLDYQGDPNRTGKAVGNDFQEGKMTLPLIYALQGLDKVLPPRLGELLAATPESRKQAIGEVQQGMEAAGAFTAARATAERLISEAVAALALFPKSEARRILEGLAGYALSRDK